MRYLFSVMLLACMASVVFGKDLGVYGTLWDIQEIDMRRILMQDASDVDWSKIGEAIHESAQKKVDAPEPFNLYPAAQTQTRYIDPTIVATKDITIPVKQPDGSYRWQILVHKGETRNPLDYVRPPQNMFFYDARDPEQVNLAIAAQAEFSDRLMLVQTAGSVNPVSKKTGMPVFYADQFLLEKLDIQHAPSLAGIGIGWFKNHFAITDFAQQDYSIQKLKEAWNGLPE